MRLIESILLFLIGLQFLLVLLKNQTKKKKLAISFLILIIAFIQIIFEGYRWQLIPSYFLFFLFQFILFLKTTTNKLLIVLRNSFCVFLLITAIVTPILLPVLEFKGLEDGYKVGLKEYNLIDNKRNEFFTKDSTDKREINIRLYYPTDNNTTKSPYIPNFDSVKSSYEKKLGWPSFMVDYLQNYSLEVAFNGNIKSENKWPLIIYSHGLTNNYTESSGRLLKLASKGYIVAAINHPYSSDIAVLSNNKIARYKPLSILGDPMKKVDFVKTIIVNQWIEDVRFLINSLKADSKIPINYENIGLIGFSAGGTMATLGSYNIEGVKAVINLDGTPRGLPENLVPKSPVLAIFSEPQTYSDAQLAAWEIDRELVEAPIRLIHKRSSKILKEAPKGSYILEIPKTKHSNFTEYPLFSPISHILGVGGRINSKECYEIINNITFSFFDKHLKNQKINLSIEKKYIKEVN